MSKTAPVLAQAGAAGVAEAFTEVAFLLGIFAATIDDLTGGATAPAGRAAGRQMARKLPFESGRLELETALEQASAWLARGYEFRCACAGRSAAIEVGRCAVRDVCINQGLEPGGALCRLFHSYFDGVVNELLASPVRSAITVAGAVCTLKLETR